MHAKENDAERIARIRTWLDQVSAPMAGEKTGQEASKLVVYDSDIFICTYPKSGTTWVQQILYQIMHPGRMDFDEITAVVPWFENAESIGIDIQSLASPRILKTHLDYESIPKANSKYIYVLRDGKDVAVSFYHFLMHEESGRLSFEDFFLEFFLKGRAQAGSWFNHVKGWLAQQGRSNVLLISYDSLKNDLRSQIVKIADFCGYALPDETIATVLRHSAFEFMKQHESQFDDHIFRRAAGGMRLQEKPEQVTSKVRDGKIGAYKTLFSPELEDIYNEEFQRHFGGLGMKNYADILATIDGEPAAEDR